MIPDIGPALATMATDIPSAVGGVVGGGGGGGGGGWGGTPIGGDLIKALSFTGTAPELRERIQGLRDAGFSQISFHIRYGQDHTVEEWAELAASV